MFALLKIFSKFKKKSHIFSRRKQSEKSIIQALDNSKKNIEFKPETLSCRSLPSEIRGFEAKLKLALFKSVDNKQGVVCTSDIIENEIVLAIPIQTHIIDENQKHFHRYKEPNKSIYLTRLNLIKTISKHTNTHAFPTNSTIFVKDTAIMLIEITKRTEYPPMMMMMSKFTEKIYNLNMEGNLSGQNSIEVSNSSLPTRPAQSFLSDFPEYSRQKIQLSMPITNIINHGGITKFPIFSGPNEGALYQLESHISQQLGKKYWQLQLKASRNISCGEEILINYGDMANEEFVNQYGFIPISNSWEGALLFEDDKRAGYWWIGCFGMDLCQKKCRYIMQTFSRTIFNYDRILTRKSTNHINKSSMVSKSNTFDSVISPSKRTLNNHRKDKKFKILSGGRIDAKMKIGFSHIWMAVDPNVHGTHALRLAEITIAIRAAQIIGLFRTSLVDDLSLLIRKGLENERSKAENDYYTKHLQHYRNELRNIENSECSITELLHIAKLFQRRKVSSITAQTLALPAVRLEGHLPLHVRVFKKMIYLDVILALRVKKLEAKTFVNLSLKRLE